MITFIENSKEISNNTDSIHRTIDNSDGEQIYLEELCEKRWETMKQPCKGCQYRFPFPENRMRCCIFGTLPKDWKIYRGEI